MTKKIYCLLVLFLSVSLGIQAQKGKVKLDFAGGAEFAEKEKGEVNGMNGYSINVDFKYYLNQKLYTLATAFISKVSAEETCIINEGELSKNGYNYNKGTNTMVGFGLGYDVLQIKKHTLFAQAAFGISTYYNEFEQRYNNDNNKDNGYQIYDSNQYNNADWGIMGKVGYNYQINSLLSVGVSYQVNYLCGYASHGVQGGLQISF